MEHAADPRPQRLGSRAWLFVGRVIAGITGASFSAAGAYIADVTPPEKRAQSFGLIGAAFGLGFILGPALGGALGDIGLRIPYFVAAGLNGANLLYGMFVLPESPAPENRRRFSFKRASPLGALQALRRQPIVLGLAGTVMCGFLAQWILQSTWALQILGHLALALADRGWMMYAILAPLALAGIAGPAAQGIISRAVGPSEQGEMQGALNSLNGIAAIVAPLVGTTLLARFATKGADPYVPGAAFFAASAFNVVGLGLAVRMFARHPENAPAPR